MRVYEELRDDIVRLVHAPGDPIYENSLAAASGLSRTPIRDALKRLRDEGLVDIRPGHGNFVARIDLDRLQEVIAMRRLLEGEAAFRAAGARDAPRLATLGRLIAAQDDAIAAGDLDEVYSFDREFHEAIFRWTGLSTMLATMRMTRAEMDRIHYIAASDISRPRRAIRHHKTIARFIGLGDAPRARSEMEAHIHSNLEYLLDHAAAHPDYLAKGNR